MKLAKGLGFILIASAILPMAAGAEPAKSPPGLSVTVVPFEAVGNVDKAVAQVVGAELESQVSAAVQKTVSEGTLKADAFVQACGQETCELKTTHRVRGSVAAFGTQYILRARLEPTDGGKILFDGTRKLPQNEDSLLLAVEDLARDIVECLNGVNCADEPGPAFAQAKAGIAPAAAVAAEPGVKPVRYEIREENGMMLVPAGEFLYGTDRKPVFLPAFRMDRSEVTVSAYAKCIEAGKCGEPSGGGGCNWDGAMFGRGKPVPGRENDPVNCVNWDDANTYCRWAGKRLPTEEEWEKAARGTDGRSYPWGERSPSCDLAVMEGNGGNGCGKESTWPVCSKPAGNSPYGLCDMAGNLWEWTANTFQGELAWYETRSDTRALRGGSWQGGQWHGRIQDVYRAAFTTWWVPAARSPHFGFRCAEGT